MYCAPILGRTYSQAGFKYSLKCAPCPESSVQADCFDGILRMTLEQKTGLCKSLLGEIYGKASILRLTLKQTDYTPLGNAQGFRSCL